MRGTDSQIILIAKAHVSDSGVQGVLQRILKRLDFKKHIHPHFFRHAYATHLIEANIPIRHFQKILGNKTINITKDALKEAQLFDKIDPSVWKKQWVIDTQAVGKGKNSLRYLSRYVFRVAISNNRIKSIENGVIKFLYKDRQKKTWKTMSLDAMEFIRRFLQHVLPKGFIHPVKFPIGNPI